MRRERLAAFKHGVFACRPVVLIAPRLIISLGPVGRKRPPSFLEVSARLVEARRGTVKIFARIRSGIESALPAPLVDVDWTTGTARDRADAHVAKIDVPTVVTFGIPVARKFGHALLKRSRDANGKPLQIAGPVAGGPSAAALDCKDLIKNGKFPVFQKGGNGPRVADLGPKTGNRFYFRAGHQEPGSC